MDCSDNLGPFGNYLDRLPELDKGNSIDSRVIDLILREVDCVKHNESFLCFINRYFSEISKSQDSTLWILSSAITNLSKNIIGYDLIVQRLIRAYNWLILRGSIVDLDADALLYFIGFLIETKSPTDLAIVALTAKIIGLKALEDQGDVMNVLSNHRITLERIYSLPNVDSFKYSLDNAIQSLS